MSFDAYAVSSAHGPHVTLQAGTLHLGRHWTTASRSSAKARAIGRTAWASSSRTRAGRTRITGGRALVLDGARPWSLLRTPVEVALAGGAVLRMGASQLEQVLGYAEAGRAVPKQYLPWGRVVLVSGVEHELVVEGSEVISARGRWAAGLSPLRSGGAGANGPPHLPAGVPSPVAALLESDRGCWLGVEARGGPVAVPGCWGAATGTVRVAAAVLAAVAAQLPGRACVTLDDSHSRRPDRKLGCMLRGGAAALHVEASTVVVTVEVERVSWWDGFSSGTATPG